MEAECSNSMEGGDGAIDSVGRREKDEVRVKRKALNAVLENCQRALELLSNAGGLEDDGDDADSDGSKGIGEDESCEGSSSSSPSRDADTDEVCEFIEFYDVL